METRTYSRVNKNGGLIEFSYSALDQDLVDKYTWHINEYGYVYTKIKIEGKWSTRFLHRLIVGAVNGILVDHKDQNPLNNTRSNLRECSVGENLCNRGKTSKNTSGYKGVFLDGRDGVWYSRISMCGSNKYLGRFYCKHLAALSYNKAAVKYHGAFACVNEVKDEDLL